MGHSVWAERYDRELKDVFEVQDDIARSITQALRITLSPQEEQVIARKPTENLQAYDLYLRGRNYTRREKSGIRDADVRTRDQAGPGLRAGARGDRQRLRSMYEWHGREPRWIERGLAACERALALEQELPEALVARARIRYVLRNYDDAIRDVQAALRKKSDCDGAYNVLGRALFNADRIEEAAELVERAIEANGNDYNMYIPFTNTLEKLEKKASLVRSAAAGSSRSGAPTRRGAGRCARPHSSGGRSGASEPGRRRRAGTGEGRRAAAKLFQ